MRNEGPVILLKLDSALLERIPFITVVEFPSIQTGSSLFSVNRCEI